MSGLAIMLAVGMVPNWMSEAPVTGVNVLPMHCVFKFLLDSSHYSGYNEHKLASLVVSEVLIVGGLVFRLVQMHKTTMDFS